MTVRDDRFLGAVQLVFRSKYVKPAAADVEDDHRRPVSIDFSTVNLDDSLYYICKYRIKVFWQEEMVDDYRGMSCLRS